MSSEKSYLYELGWKHAIDAASRLVDEFANITRKKIAPESDEITREIFDKFAALFNVTADKVRRLVPNSDEDKPN